MNQPKNLNEIVLQEANISVLDGKVIFRVSKEKAYDYEFEQKESAELFATGLQRVVELFTDGQIPINKDSMN